VITAEINRKYSNKVSASPQFHSIQEKSKEQTEAYAFNWYDARFNRHRCSLKSDCVLPFSTCWMRRKEKYYMETDAYTTEVKKKKHTHTHFEKIFFFAYVDSSLMNNADTSFLIVQWNLRS
jgi:hypothetical protein